MTLHHRLLFVALSLLSSTTRANSAIVGGETGHDAADTLRFNLWAVFVSGDVGLISTMVLLLAGPLLMLVGTMFAFRAKKRPMRGPLIGALGLLFALVTMGVVMLKAPAPSTATTTQPTTTADAADANGIAWVRITDTADALAAFDAVLAGSKAAHQPVFIDFGAEWCTACKELDKTTFVDPAVRAEAARFVAIKVDATNESPALNAIQERFGVVGLPTIAFIGSDGVYLDPAAKAPRYEAVTGYATAAELLPQLQRVR